VVDSSVYAFVSMWMIFQGTRERERVEVVHFVSFNFIT
jgi:hypothetical protein